MAKYYKEFAVAGVANDTTLDAGLVSLVDENYRIIEVLIMTNEWQGNFVEGWIGNERVMEIPDYVFDTNDDLATNPRSTQKINKIELDHNIPAGAIFKIGIRCGANATNIYGSYVYEKVSP